MRYLGGGIGHHTTATGPSSKEIDTAQVEDDTDSEMNPEEVIEDANHTQGPQVDDLEDPDEDDYEHDVVVCGEVVVQEDELQDYEYTQGVREDTEMDPEYEGLEDIDGYGLGPEDGEDDEYFHSDLEYD